MKTSMQSWNRSNPEWHHSHQEASVAAPYLIDEKGQLRQDWRKVNVQGDARKRCSQSGIVNDDYF